MHARHEELIDLVKMLIKTSVHDSGSEAAPLEARAKAIRDKAAGANAK